MTSYDAVMTYLGQKLPNLTQAQQVQVAQQLITYFVQHLPTDWLIQELPSEQVHYKTLAKLITTQTWETDALSHALTALDEIMWQMGDAYPHTTGDYPLQLLILLDYYLQLVPASTSPDTLESVSNQPETLADPTATMIMLADEFLGFYEKQAEQQGHDVQLDQWLSYPPISQAVSYLTTLLEPTNIQNQTNTDHHTIVK